MTVKLHHLANGVPVLIDRMPQADRISIEASYAVGALQETPELNGMSHFREHMAFKGTESRSASQLKYDIADLGASANAGTGYERTNYHITGLAKEAPQLAGLLDDVLHRSTLPLAELETERGTILEEIDRAEDVPERIAANKILTLAYPGQRYGTTILGPRANIEALDRATMLNFMQCHEHAGNLILSVAGKMDVDKILAQLDNTFGRDLAGVANDYPEIAYVGGLHHHEWPLKQIKLSLCFNAYARREATHAPTLMNAILGGGMSSRLYQEVREKRGLVYSVSSGLQAFLKGGTLKISAGTGPQKVAALMSVVADEIEKICQDRVTDAELNRAKTRVLSSMAAAKESVTGRRERAISLYANYGRVVSDRSRLAAFNAVSREDVQAAAQRIFSGKPTLVTIGPGSTMEPVEKLAARLRL